MLDGEHRAAALSQLVLQLHRGSRSWPAGSFQDRACELLADVLPFDCALWGAENPHTQRAVALHPYRIPDNCWAHHLTHGLAADPLLAAARAAVGMAVVMSPLPVPLSLPVPVPVPVPSSLFSSQSPSPAALAALAAVAEAAGDPGHAGLHAEVESNPEAAASGGAGHGMAMAQTEPLSKLRSYFCIWRGPDHAPFGPGDQQLLQFVVPHLMETARESQLARPPAGAEAAPPRSHAVCDLQGALQHLDDRCQALLRLEWPQWPGGVLPAPLLAALSQALASGEAGPTFVGRRVAVRMAVSGPTVLLAARLRAACDKLSARQRSIADLYASGCTGPEIAQRLGLAASTVNNHLGDVFKKLQVSSKLQLVRALKGADS